jgi:hypothetical protein
MLKFMGNIKRALLELYSSTITLTKQITKRVIDL